MLTEHVAHTPSLYGLIHPPQPPQLLPMSMLMLDEPPAAEGAGPRVAEARGEDKDEDKEPWVEVEYPDEAEDAATPAAWVCRRCFFGFGLAWGAAGCVCVFACVEACARASGLMTGRGFGGPFFTGAGTVVAALTVAGTSGALLAERVFAVALVDAIVRLLGPAVLGGTASCGGFAAFAAFLSLAVTRFLLTRCTLEDGGSERLPSAGRFFDADVEAEPEEIVALVFVLRGIEGNGGLDAEVCAIVLGALFVAFDPDTERAFLTRRILDGPAVGSSALRLEETDVLRCADGPAGTRTSPPPMSSVSSGLGSTMRYCKALM